MAEKELLHQGFYIPNAGDVSNPRMAEPDRVDFNTLAHPLWGVIEGCKVSVVGSQAQAAAGTVLVNGALVTLTSTSAPLSVNATLDSFNLVVVNSGGVVQVIPGPTSTDPVFPDPPLNTTVLAAVFCPAGGGTLSNNVIDKRKFINKALLTKIGTGDALVRNLNGTGNHYLVQGDGTTTWSNDTWMWRSGVEELSVHRNLKLEGTLTAASVMTSGNVAATGNVYGANLHWDIAAPSGTATPGTIWQDATSGKVYVRKGGSWQEMATIASANPVGSVITSFEVPAVMAALGWLPLKGDVINENDYPNVFGVQGLLHLINTPPTGPRTMRLPDATRRVLLSDFGAVNPGVATTPNIGNKVALTTTNLPSHRHNPKVSPAGAANPIATVGRNGGHRHDTGGGQHGHTIDDPGHKHHGFDYGGSPGGALVGLVWGGQNKVDALFNDRNHTYSVEAVEWIAEAKTNITVQYEESGHEHDILPNGEHDHPVNISGISDHTHVASDDLVGNGTPFDITPEYIVVYSYIRT